MPRKPADLLAKLAAEHPAAFTPDRVAVTEAKLRRALAADPKVALNIKVARATMDAVTELAARSGKSVSFTAAMLLQEALASRSDQ